MNSDSLSYSEKHIGNYPGCAETTFAIVADAMGLQNADVFSAVIALSGGIAGLGTGSCGAIAGAATAIGLMAKVSPDDLKCNPKLQDEIFRRTALVAEAFENKYGGLSCLDVQTKLYGRSFDLRTTEGRREFDNNEKKCAEVCNNAASWAIEVIRECHTG